MNLVDKIIETLSSQGGSLTDALLKTKVLLHKIGHKELVAWVNHELNGYPEGEPLPEYRVLSAQVLANMSNGAWQATAHPIPLGHLDKDQREIFETAKMSQSLAVLEKMAGGGGGKSKRMKADLPMEANGLLSKGLANGFMIQRAWCEFSAASMEQIFVQVRSRLLDFVLGLKDQLGEHTADEEIRERTIAIDAPGLFKSAIFGNNTTIIVGSNNKQQVKNVNLVGNFDAMAELLRKHGVTEPDLENLAQAISKDRNAPEIKEQHFGPAIKGWMQKMLGKAVDTSWQIELGIAGNLISDVLKAFYGRP